MENILISIVVPLYNKEACIAKTIDSVIHQTYANWELVIVDDGSTDGSGVIVKQYNDNRISYYLKENGGPSSARNYGVQKAKADWIVFLDADDYFLPDALAHFNILRLNNPEFLCFCCNFILERNQIQERYSYIMIDGMVKNPFRDWLSNRFYPRTGAAMFHKKVLLQFPHKENLRRYEDAEMLFNIMRIYRFYRSKKNVMVYNCNTLAASVRKNYQEDFLSCLDIEGKTYWECVALYNFYLRALKNYPLYAKQKYENVFSGKESCYIKSLKMCDNVKKINRLIKKIAKFLLR